MNWNRKLSTKTWVSFLLGATISSVVTAWFIPLDLHKTDIPHGRVTRVLDGKTTSYTAECEVLGQYGYPVVCDVNIEAGPITTRDVIITLGPYNNASVFVGSATELFEYTQEGETLTLTHLDSDHSWVFHHIFRTGLGVFR